MAHVDSWEGAQYIPGKWNNHLAGVHVTHVPYKGAAAATNEVVSGQVAYQFARPVTVLSLAKAGRLRLLAVTSAKRAVALPDLPTVAERGVPGFEVTNWFGMVAPPATPPCSSHACMPNSNKRWRMPTCD